MSVSIASRMDKLHRMASHPRANQHEAEIARRELERLRREYPAVTAKQQARATDRYYEVFSESYRRGVEEQRRRQDAGVLVPGDAGYYAWAGSLGVGDKVRVGRMGVLVSWRTGDILKIVRVTPTKYVMGNGHKYRRTGKFPGYYSGAGDNTSYIVRLS